MHSCPVFPALLIEEIASPLYIYIYLPPLSKIRCPQVCQFISGLSILFLSCQYYAVLMTVALQYSVSLGRLIPPAPFFFLRIALTIWGLMYFHTNCEIIYSSSVKNIGSLIRIALNLQIALGNIVIFTILIIPIQEHGTSLQLFVFSFFYQ